MADANVGSIVATLSVDARAWQQGLRQAEQQLAQFAGQITRLTSQLNQFSTAFQQAFQQSQQGLNALPQRTQQASQSFQQFNTQLNQTNQAFTVVNQTVQQFNTQINNTATTVNNTRQAMQQAQGATSAFANILQIAAGIGLATSLQGMLQAVVSFGREVIQTGARLEQLRASLSAIAGSTAAGQQQFQFLTATAQQLGVSLEPIARGWRALTAAATQANLPLTDQQRLFTALITEARRVGASSEEVNRALTAVAQTASKGKVSMEELRQQLGEALPTAFAAVARGMGRTTEELEKLIETGSVRFPAFARALTRGFEQMQAASGQMTETSQAAFNRLGNALTAFKDALAQNILPELARIARVAQTILETATNIVNLTGGRGGGGVQGPTLGELGATSQQQQEVERLNRLIERYQREQGLGTPVMQEQRRTMLENAIKERDILLESIRATQDQRSEQEKVTAETNKTADAQQRQADYVKDLRKALDDLRKAREDYNKEAALAPERMGRPGTAEFLEGQRKAIAPQLEAVTGLAAQPPQGVVLPADLRQQLADADIQYGRLGKQIDAIKDKEQERARAAREASAQAERAISQEISLTAQLARVKAFVTRPEESTSAERARQQVLQQGVEMQRIVDDALRQFEQSPALRERAPQLLEDFTKLKEGLREAMDTQATQAFNNAIKQDVIEPLERLAETYGVVKAARDADKASTLEAAAANTVHATRATELATAIREVAQIEAQLPELRRQAALSAPAGELALKRVRDEAEALRVLEENLEQARIPRGGGGFPFGRTREELRLQQRTGEDIRSPEGQQRAQELQRARLAQEQLNYAAGLFEQLGQSVGSAWINALQGIADHTATVSEAFRAMAQSIIQSLGQIAAQEGFKALIGLGVRLIAGAAVGGAGVGVNPMMYGSPIGPTLDGGAGGAGFGGAGGFYDFGMQHGGIVHGPTRIMAGENPSTAPEAIFNRQQLQNLFGGGGSLGGGPGRESNVSIINVPNRQAAEQMAAQERALGKQVVINYINENLAMGESSSILRSLRTLQR